MDTHEKDLRRLLAALDAAPVRALTEAERNRRDELLSNVMESETSAPQVTAPIRRRRPLLWVAAGAMAAAATVVVATQNTHTAPAAAHHAAQSAPGTTFDLVGWTGTPSHLQTTAPQAQAAERWCVEGLKPDFDGQTPTYSNVDVRGSVTSVVVTGKVVAYCIVDHTGFGMAEVIDPVVNVAANGIKVDSAGGYGNAPGSVQYLEGSVGADVTAVSVRADGRTTKATLDNKRFTAWWPAPSLSDGDGTLVLTLKNGSTRTVPISYGS